MTCSNGGGRLRRDRKTRRREGRERGSAGALVAWPTAVAEADRTGLARETREKTRKGQQAPTARRGLQQWRRQTPERPEDTKKRRTRKRRTAFTARRSRQQWRGRTPDRFARETPRAKPGGKRERTRKRREDEAKGLGWVLLPWPAAVATAADFEPVSTGFVWIAGGFIPRRAGRATRATPRAQPAKHPERRPRKSPGQARKDARKARSYRATWPTAVATAADREPVSTDFVWIAGGSIPRRARTIPRESALPGRRRGLRPASRKGSSAAGPPGPGGRGPWRFPRMRRRPR